MGLVDALVGLFLFYFVAVYGGRVLMHLLAVPALLRGMALRPFQDMPATYSGFDPPISVLLPVGNDDARVVAAVRALLELDYPQFEVLVICDGSTDNTLATLKGEFELEAFPEALWRRIPSQPVRTVYQSRTHDHLRLVDKEPGGRADALNAGLNASRYPLFCAVSLGDAIEHDCLLRLAEPFLEDPANIACAAAMRIAGGGKLTSLLQLVESLPMLLFRRLGWGALDAMLVMPGDLVLFRKDVVVEAMGFRAGSECEEADLVLRLHRTLRGRRERYAMRFVPDPVASKPAHATLRAIARPRMAWQHELAAGVARNATLFSMDAVSRGPALPWLLLLETYGPLVELAGYLFMAAMWAFGLVSGAMLAAFLALAVALGFLASATALLLETLSSDMYPRLRQLLLLALVALVENAGYRQLMTALRAAALLPRYRPRA
jgi:cellulose synthase/poly-beta-1,6-N-acetylglucosamine synthase-like glycosyltransferase